MILKSNKKFYLIACLIVVIVLKGLPIKELLGIGNSVYFEYFEKAMLSFICLIFSFFLIKKNKLNIYFLKLSHIRITYILPLLICVLIYTSFFSKLSQYGLENIPSFLILLYFLKILVGVLFEEFFFRGFIVGYLINFFKQNKYLVCLYAAILFGIPHFINLFNQYHSVQSVINQVLVAGGLGFLYAAFYINTKSLLFTILFHFANNFVASLNILHVGYFDLEYSIMDETSYLEFVFETIFVLFLGAIPIVFGLAILKKTTCDDLQFFRSKS